MSGMKNTYRISKLFQQVLHSDAECSCCLIKAVVPPLQMRDLPTHQYNGSATLSAKPNWISNPTSLFTFPALPAAEQALVAFRFPHLIDKETESVWATRSQGRVSHTLQLSQARVVREESVSFLRYHSHIFLGFSSLTSFSLLTSLPLLPFSALHLTFFVIFA